MNRISNDVIPPAPLGSTPFFWRGRNSIVKVVDSNEIPRRLPLQGSAPRNDIRIFLLVALTGSLLFAGCFPGGGHYDDETQAGFFSGVWHGWIAPISLIYSFFEPDVRIYEPNNTGWWYDFGFYIAIIGGFGGISVIRRKKKG